MAGSLGEDRRAAVGLALGLLIVSASTCQRADPPVAGTVTLVNRVRAEVRGVSCAACPATLEAALRQRLEPATITIEPGRSVAMAFERSAAAFPSASFRQAVADGQGETVSIRAEVCGSIETTGSQSWITSGSSRLLLEGPGPYVTGVDVCVTGELRDQASPPRLVTTK